MTTKAPVPQEYKVSVKQFLKFSFIYKKNIFEMKNTKTHIYLF